LGWKILLFSPDKCSVPADVSVADHQRVLLKGCCTRQYFEVFSYVPEFLQVLQTRLIVLIIFTNAEALLTVEANDSSYYFDEFLAL
jgi:hypothetical protein